jgi:hypothetical protein
VSIVRGARFKYMNFFFKYLPLHADITFQGLFLQENVSKYALNIAEAEKCCNKCLNAKTGIICQRVEKKEK